MTNVVKIEYLKVCTELEKQKKVKKQFRQK